MPVKQIEWITRDGLEGGCRGGGGGGGQAEIGENDGHLWHLGRGRVQGGVSASGVAPRATAMSQRARPLHHSLWYTPGRPPAPVTVRGEIFKNKKGDGASEPSPNQRAKCGVG